jgi:chemotaxis protein CheX
LPADRPVIPLPAVLDLRAVEALSSPVAAAVSSGGTVLDASAVERVTTPALQYLITAGAAADAAGRPFALAMPSPALAAALATLGLGPRFARWIDA